MFSYLWVYDFVSPALVLIHVYTFYVWLSTSVMMVRTVKLVQSHGDQCIIMLNMFKPGLWLCSGIDPPDVQREKDGIGALQALERKEDHSVATCLLS